MMQKKSCRENQNTHFMSSNPPIPEKRAVRGILWSIAGRITDISIMRRMRITCRIAERKNTFSYPSVFDWLAAFHLDLLQAILFIAV
jgi:hypothetical protein